MARTIYLLLNTNSMDSKSYNDVFESLTSATWFYTQRILQLVCTFIGTLMWIAFKFVWKSQRLRSWNGVWLQSNHIIVEWKTTRYTIAIYVIFSRQQQVFRASVKETISDSDGFRSASGDLNPVYFRIERWLTWYTVILIDDEATTPSCLHKSIDVSWLHISKN